MQRRKIGRRGTEGAETTRCQGAHSPCAAGNRERDCRPKMDLEQEDEYTVSFSG